MSECSARRDAPKRTPFASACLAIADLKMKDLKPDPGDTVPLAIAKVLALEALAGNVNAAAELANRAEGYPTQVVQYEPAESASEGLDPETMAMVMRIAKAWRSGIPSKN